MRVLFVSAGDEERASSRLRVFNMFPYLEDAGIEPSSFDPIRFAERVPGPEMFGLALSLVLLGLKAPRYDVVYVQKIPLPRLYVKILRVFTPVVYDFDDALYTSPAWKDDDSKWKWLLDGSLEGASVVVAGSSILAEYAADHAEVVHSLPTALPRERYEAYDVAGCQSGTSPRDAEVEEVPPDEDSERRAGGTDESITLVWIGNPENLRYLEARSNAIAKVLDRNESARLRVVTAGELPVEPLRYRADVAYREWSLEEELDLLATADVGIRPLFDDEWTRGKGGFTSVVQMMALGLPVVITPVSMLAELVVDGETGYHASTDEEWIADLERLIEDSDRRCAMGKAARNRIDESGFWTADRAAELVDIFQRLAPTCEPDQ